MMVRGGYSEAASSVLRSLARVLGMSAEFWLDLQQSWDLWHAMHGPGAEAIAALQPIRTQGRDR